MKLRVHRERRIFVRQQISVTAYPGRPPLDTDGKFIHSLGVLAGEKNRPPGDENHHRGCNRQEIKDDHLRDNHEQPEERGQPRHLLLIYRIIGDGIIFRFRFLFRHFSSYSIALVITNAYGCNYSNMFDYCQL